MKTFNDLTIEEVKGILRTALDDNEWHTASVSDVNIKEQSVYCVYGWCNISLHNRYHDKEIWFSINANTVHIWEKEYVKDKSDKCLFKKIYNLKQLGNILSALQFKEVSPQTNSQSNK